MLAAATAAPERPVLRVHALVDSLACGGAEVLLADFAAVAREAGIVLSVGFLAERPGPSVADRLRAAGIAPLRVGATGLASPRSLARVRAHLAAVGADVVHTHLGYSDALGGLAARSLGIPAVSTVHAMTWDGSPRERAKAGLMGRVRRDCMARVIAVSDAARAAYLATSWDRPERVVTVRNGVAREPRPGAGAAVRAELGLAAGDLVVTTVSALRAEKAHGRVIAAFAELAAREPRARLLLVGDGPEREALARIAAPLGRAVLMPGYRADVMELLDASDLVLHAPPHDALPTTLIEAAAASVPAVATGVGGIPEIVADGHTGTVVEGAAGPERLAAAAAALLADPDGRRRMGRAARSRFEAEFSPGRWAERVRSLYDAVLASPRPRRPRRAACA